MDGRDYAKVTASSASFRVSLVSKKKKKHVLNLELILERTDFVVLVNRREKTVTILII